METIVQELYAKYKNQGVNKSSLNLIIQSFHDFVQKKMYIKEESTFQIIHVGKLNPNKKVFEKARQIDESKRDNTGVLQLGTPHREDKNFSGKPLEDLP